jgi:hypothetical protein
MSETVDQRILWDEAKVRDLVMPPSYHGGACCTGGPSGFVCSRQKGHTGQHVAIAEDPAEIMAAWPGEPS